MNNRTITFNGEQYTVRRFTYPVGGRNGLMLVDANGEDAFKASVNPPAATHMETDEVAVKNYSENEGVLAALVDAGIIAAPHDWVGSGYVELPICRLLPEE